MAYYIKDKQTGEWQYYGYSDEFPDGYWYLSGTDLKCATKFDFIDQCRFAILSAKMGLEGYEIVEVE